MRLEEDLKKYWHNKGFDAATPIQKAVYQPIIEKQSFVAISPTGTGKTLAYLLPLIQTIEANNVLQVIILAPSQELVKQIGEVAQEWAQLLGLKTQVILGGANISRQIEQLKDKPEIIVATPGRFVELLNQTRKLKVHMVKTIVYDEADYLWQDEHRPALEQIEKRLDKDVQKIWVSATLGAPLLSLVQAPTTIPLIHMTSQDNKLPIEHYYILTTDRQKPQLLKRLGQVDNMQAIVFFEQVNELDQVASKLIYDGIKVAVLHSQVSKFERQHAIESFKAGEVTYLLTTDLAGRGMDIPALPYAIHYNRVNNLDTYFHRSGRVGRMGHKGVVISLVNEQEHRDLQKILDARSIQLTEKIVFQQAIVDPEVREIEKEAPTNAQSNQTKSPASKPRLAKERTANAGPKANVKKRKVRLKKKKDKGKPKR
ncbi:DEAD/DEAH box helicase [Fundicoccus culcitae]|uniref:DEAD/DEAH box helicase n=1 Tax=Fundicoccus culcitae TaxID=2969821 RepID=A0ABY5P503_9LACT|nr:DEAD/DEAH box helicase [Fundicoccus culcitae]UUX33834.1 DEAD/DEAH box helicase [Fundicoccus culcitae]